ncbi:MAG: DegV family protein [Oscillospiraceae bacterium]
MNSYKILTDATVDLPYDFAKEQNLEIIPMEFTIDCQSFTFGGSDSIKSEDFFALMRQGKIAHTSQINPIVYKKYFSKYLKEGIDIIYICFSSGLSGTLENAKAAAAELQKQYPERKIYCVDSLCASAGEGFLAYGAAEQFRQGKGIDEVRHWLESYKLKVAHWFTVEDLEHLHRGGRVSKATAIVGGALQIKPVMNMDDCGRLISMEKLRGRAHSIQALAQKYAQSRDDTMSEVVFIAHGDCATEAEFLRSLVLSACPKAQVHIFPMGPIIGAHTGAGVISLYFWAKER